MPVGWPGKRHRRPGEDTDPEQPFLPPHLREDESGDLPEPGPDDDWYHPSPRCIRRLEPFNLTRSSS